MVKDNNLKKSYTLFAVILLIILIFFGGILRHHYLGGKKFQTFQKIAVFFAEIPFNIKFVILHKTLYGNKILPLNDIVYKSKKDFDKKLKSNREELILLSRYDSDQQKSIVEVRDINTFEILHTYDPNISDLLIENNIKDFTVNDKFYMWHPIVTSDGSLIFKNNSPLIKINFNNELVWINNDGEYSHATELDLDENIYVTSIKKDISQKVYEYVGTYSSKIDDKYVFTDNHINIINNEGKIIFSKSVSEILIENGYDYKIFPQSVFIIDPIHLNDIQPVLQDSPYFKKDDLFLSLRNLHMIMLYRPKTNKIIKIIEGPFSNQHDVDIINNKTISIFNNNTFIDYKNERYVKNNNEILFYDFETDKFSKKFENTLKEKKISTIFEGLADFLVDGSAIIEETDNGRIIFVNKDGDLIWEYYNLDSKKRLYNVWWSRVLTVENSKKLRKIIIN